MDLPAPPKDIGLRNIIDKLAEFVARNGPEFEAITKAKQQGNPKFGFLYGGDYYQYYQWRVSSEQTILKQQGSLSQAQNLPPIGAGGGNAPSGVVVVDGNGGGGVVVIGAWDNQGPKVPPHNNHTNSGAHNSSGAADAMLAIGAQVEALNAQQATLRDQIHQSEQNLSAQQGVLVQQQQSHIDEAIVGAQHETLVKLAIEHSIRLSEFDDVLQPIVESCTKDSISAGKNWILQHTTDSPKCNVILQYLLKKALLNGAPFTQKLHLIYLVNDVLHHCVRKRADDLKNQLENIVIPMFCSGQMQANDDQKSKLTKLLSLWESKANFFDACVISKLKSPVSSMQEYKTNLLNTFAALVASITQQTSSTFESYKQQHQTFIHHAGQQIVLLETQKQGLLEKQKQALAMPPMMGNSVVADHHQMQQQQHQHPPPQQQQQQPPPSNPNNPFATGNNMNNMNNGAGGNNINNNMMSMGGQQRNDRGPPMMAPQQQHQHQQSTMPNMNQPPPLGVQNAPPPHAYGGSNSGGGGGGGGANMDLNNFSNPEPPPSSMFPNQKHTIPANQQHQQQLQHQLQHHHQSLPLPNSAAFDQPPPNFLIPDMSKPPPGFSNPPPPEAMAAVAAAAASAASAAAAAAAAASNAVIMPTVPPQEVKPVAPFYELPAGLMVPLIRLEDYEYHPLEPEDLRLPPPVPPSERLLSAVDAFYAPPSHDRPRDGEGWEKLALYEYYKVKNSARKTKEEEIASGARQRSRSPSPIVIESTRPTKINKRRYRSKSRSRSRSPNQCAQQQLLLAQQQQQQQQHQQQQQQQLLARKSPSPTPSDAPRKTPGGRKFGHYSNRSPKRASRSISPPSSTTKRSDRVERGDREPRTDRSERSAGGGGAGGNDARGARGDRDSSESPPPSFFGGNYAKPASEGIEESNKGHQMLMKMGWAGSGTGLGSHGQGIDAPISGGEVRDRQDQFKGVGISLNDPYENFRKNKGAAFIHRMRSRDTDRKPDKNGSPEP